MNNFEFYTPTRVVFGRNTEEKIGALVKAQKCKKVLIHYGGGSVIRSGLLDRVKASLEAENISYTELGGVVPNPRLSLVYKGIELAKKENVDFILAVGGGSTIDSSKAIAFGASNDCDVWDFYDRIRDAKACLPVGVVLTIAAAGSEMSESTVITNENGQIKRGYSNDLCRPVFAVMNPELTTSLPAYQTACGCTDIIMHTLERYFTNGEKSELTDSIAEGVLKTVITNAKIVHNDPQNYSARAEIMWAGSVSHNGLTGCGNSENDFASHALEHELSGIYDVVHGAGLAAVWGSWARYVYKDCLHRFTRFARNVMNVSAGDEEQTALAGIKKLEEFFSEIGMPVSISGLGVSPSEEELRLMAHKCAVAFGGKRGSAKVLYEDDMYNIYKAAL